MVIIMSEELRKQIGNNQEMKASEIAKAFADAGIDTSVRAAAFEEVKQKLQDIHDVLAKHKVPFLFVLDISDVKSMQEGKSLCVSSMNLPGGPTSNMLRKAADIFCPRNELETALEELSPENLFLECKAAGLEGHPDVPVSTWIKKVKEGETNLGYWDFVSEAAKRTLVNQINTAAEQAVMSAITSGITDAE